MTVGDTVRGKYRKIEFGIGKEYEQRNQTGKSCDQ